MIPGTYDFTVHRSSPVSIPLAFTSATTGDPINFTGFIQAGAPATVTVAGDLADSLANPITFPPLLYAGVVNTGGLDTHYYTPDGEVNDPNAQPGDYYDIQISDTGGPFGIAAGLTYYSEGVVAALWQVTNLPEGTTDPATIDWTNSGVFGSTGDPVVTTAPAVPARSFTAQVRDNADSPVLLSFTVTSSDLEGGLLDLTATAADTARIPTRDARWDLIDYTGAVWLEGICKLRRKISVLP